MRRILLFLLILFTGCVAPTRPSAGETPDADKTPGFVFELKDGTPIDRSREKVPPAKTTALSEQTIQQILARLPKLPVKSGDQVAFAKRADSQPAPRTGETLKEAFPPPPSDLKPNAVEAKELEVLRFSPEGEVELAPHLSITFNQPMIAISSQEEASKVRPVKLTPEPKGQWRWVGTKTLLFEPDPRFPMATSYKVEIPAGTKSTGGKSLSAAKSFEFGTPAPRFINTHPNGGPTELQPIIFIGFDQKIDPRVMVKHLKIKSGSNEFPVRIASAADRAEEKHILNMIDGAEEGRWMTVIPSQPLPKDSHIQVVLEKGAPSEEGPRTTPADQSLTFATYSPLKVVDQNGTPENKCRPLSSLWMRFNNPLDEEKFKPSMVTVTPKIPGLRVEARGDSISLRGRTKGRTTYKVKLSASLPDSFGQTLGKSEELTFHVGPADRMLGSQSQGLVVLDPYGKASYPIYSINVDKVRLLAYKVEPKDWKAFGEYYRRWQNDPPPPLPGKEVLNTVVEIENKPDELVETTLDLSEALPDGVGQVAIIVEDTQKPKNRWERRKLIAWAQATQIGLDAMVDHEELVALVTDLKDGSPLDGVELSIHPTGQNQTSQQGVARLELPASSPQETNILVARKGKDVALLPENSYFYGSGGQWVKRSQTDNLLWHVFDDRQMYKPGETVSIKGWIRTRQAGTKGDLVAAPKASGPLTYTVYDSRGNKIGEGKTEIQGSGGFNFSFELPKTPNLGHARINLQAPVGLSGSSRAHTFQIQEFRRPEFEVSTSPSDGPHMMGESAKVKVQASYYAGGGLPAAEVNWSVSSSPGSFRPPGHDEFSFGQWTPWWSTGRWWRAPSQPGAYKGLESKTDGAGAHYLELDFKSVWPPAPTSVTAEASVTDVNRQRWSSSSSLLVHPAHHYVGLKSSRTFVQPGEDFELEAVVADLDGEVQTGRDIQLRLVRQEWVYEKGEYQQKELNPETRTVKSKAEPVAFKFRPKEGGSYRLTATIEDEEGRLNQSTLSLWVAGGKVPTSQKVEQEQITLIPDRKSYKPGETAEILMQAPFADAEGVMTLRRNGLLMKERFKVDGTSHTFKVKLEEYHTPNVHFQVDLVGATQRTGADGKPLKTKIQRPAYATGHLNLPVPPETRKLTVEVKPRVKALQPGGETEIEVELKDAAGQAVAGGEVSVVVVDESVLALSGYNLADPLGSFYPQRPAGVNDFHNRGYVSLASPEVLLEEEPQAELTMADEERDKDSFATGAVEGRGDWGVGGEAPAPSGAPPAQRRMRAEGLMSKKSMNGASAPPPPIKMRTNFSALALFKASALTDPAGKVTVPVKLPDNLTRYRIMVVAAAGERQFGKGESTLTARLPLMLRPSPPRFLNFGDRCELPLVLQNQTDQDMEVELAMRAHNAKITDGAGQKVTVKANDRVEVRFPVDADQAGTARFQVGVVSPKFSDAAQFEFPVWTPATSEAFATYGEIDKGAIAQPVRRPGDVWPQFGGLEITTSSTAVGALTDAVLYLVAYPFECSEQVSSRVLAIAALRDVLQAFKADGLPPKADLIAAVERDVEKLQSLQNYDGGFDFWIRGKPSHPYVSIHVGHALVRAKMKGFKVPQEMLDRNRQFLTDIDSHIPHYYSLEARRALRAYALYVRWLQDDKDPAEGKKILALAPVDKTGLETLGWLLPVLSKDPMAKEIRHHLNNRVSETAATAQFTTSYGDSAHLLLYSSRRTDAVLLEALMIDSPKSDLIPKLVRGLLAHRKRGRWGNTQENVWVLLAMDRYFNTYEKVEPDFVARIWLGGDYGGGHKFKGRQTEERLTEVPMKLVPEKEKNLIIQKDGKGRLYYRIGMKYAPKNLRLEPADYGFAVERKYEAVDDNRDVTRDPDGTWHIKAGAKVRVRLTMVAPQRRYHVALVDPLPAGLEPMNPALAVTGTVPQDPNNRNLGWWWGGAWYEHQNMRDERVEAFSSLVWSGVYNYSYVAVATTPGKFVVPPTKAEEMYYPETFGRSGTDIVMVE